MDDASQYPAKDVVRSDKDDVDEMGLARDESEVRARNHYPMNTAPLTSIDFRSKGMEEAKEANYASIAEYKEDYYKSPEYSQDHHESNILSDRSCVNLSLPSALRDHDFGFPVRPLQESESNETVNITEKMDVGVDDGMKDHPSVSVDDKDQECKETPVYCICRTSAIDRFMIGCDKCSEWFHGDCVNLHKHEAKKVEEWYCQSCLEKHPDLEIKYKAQKSYHFEGSSSKKGKRVSRICGECIACKKTEDCAECDYFQDMKKFGGEGRLRQKCRLRQCLKLSKIFTKKSCKYTFPEEYLRQYREFMKQEQNYPEDASNYKEWDSSIVSVEDEGNNEKRKAIKVKHAKQTSLDRQKKRKDKEFKDLMKKQLKEAKLAEMERKKEERQKRRKQVEDNKQKRKLHGHKDDYGSSKRQDFKKEEPRHCLGPGCINAAMPNSKYCCDECGVQLALRRLQEILPDRSKIWKETECVANQKGEELIAKIHKQHQIAQQRLLELDKEHAEFEAMLEKSKQLTICEEEENDDNEVDMDLTVDCVSCGALLAPRIALKHMEKCYAKLECLTSFGAIYKSAGNLFCDKQIPQQGTYCKRLRVLCPEHTKDSKIGANEVCGCPLNEKKGTEVTEFCRAPKRKCTKHFYWEKLRRAEIDLKRLHEWWKLEEGLEQERSIRMSMTNRGGVIGMLLHQTIEHSKQPKKVKE